MIKKIFQENYKISESNMNKFDTFYNFLVEENQKYNLTSITDEASAYEKHFFDSLSILKELNLEGTMCDVGSGGGMPGIPLAIMSGNLKVTFLDSNHKKTEFCDKACKLLNIEHECLNVRAEECNQKFDIVIARGVANLSILIELCTNLIKENGLFIAMKGSNYQEELDEAKNAISTLGYELIKKQEYTLPIEGSGRCNLIFKKIKSHDKKYPRPFGQIKKKPL